MGDLLRLMLSHALPTGVVCLCLLLVTGLLLSDWAEHRRERRLLIQRARARHLDDGALSDDILAIDDRLKQELRRHQPVFRLFRWEVPCCFTCGAGCRGACGSSRRCRGSSIEHCRSNTETRAFATGYQADGRSECLALGSRIADEPEQTRAGLARIPPRLSNPNQSVGDEYCSAAGFIRHPQHRTRAHRRSAGSFASTRFHRTLNLASRIGEPTQRHSRQASRVCTCLVWRDLCFPPPENCRSRDFAKK